MLRHNISYNVDNKPYVSIKLLKYFKTLKIIYDITIFYTCPYQHARKFVKSHCEFF